MTAPEWYHDHAELSEVAAVLADVYAWECVEDVLRFLEKPWKWTPERNRWVALGRPDPATLDDNALEVDQ